MKGAQVLFRISLLATAVITTATISGCAAQAGGKRVVRIPLYAHEDAAGSDGQCPVLKAREEAARAELAAATAAQPSLEPEPAAEPAAQPTAEPVAVALAEPVVPEPRPVRLEPMPPPAASRAMPANWPLHPSEIEGRLANEGFVLTEVKSAGGGVTGASRLTLAFPERGDELKVKWKPVPEFTADESNNSARAEMGAYEVQKLFLAPEDYQVPTAAMRCMPMDAYVKIDHRAVPNVYRANCILGMMAAWLNDVTVPETLWDPDRFASDAVYAHHMSDFNVLTYLIGHRDGRDGNFLIGKDPETFQVFAIDNGIAFEPAVWNYFVINWNEMRIPAVRSDTVERLRRLTRADLDRFGVLSELHRDGEGLFHPVVPGANMGPERGVRRSDGVIQFGLSSDELDNLAERIAALIDNVDRGEIDTF